MFAGDLHEYFLDWTSDGSQIIFSHGKTIHAIDAEGARTRVIADVNPTHDLHYHFHADASPAGDSIVYTTCRFPTDPPSGWRPSTLGLESWAPWFYDRLRRHYEIATANIDGSETRRLTENIHLDHYPAWSPDGTRIAFISNPMRWKPNSGQLYTIAADGTDVRLLTPSLPSNVALFPPAWSPDGRRIAFIALEKRQKVLYTVGADGSDLTRISRTTGAPSWAPDGSEIAFVADGDAATGHIYAARPDGTSLRLVAPVQATRVAWSPDGAEILFVAGSVHIVKADGSGLRTIDAPQAVNAAWSPDGSRIAMLGFDGDAPGWKWGDYRSSGRIATIARDGTDLRILARWERSGAGKDDPGELAAGNPDPLGAPDEMAPCAAGVVVPNPESNTALVKDCEALLALRDTFTPRAFLNWGAHLPLADWDGVAVGGSPARIRGLALQDFGLSGPIPPELGELTALERLNLRRNSLRGAIPSSFSRLTELRELHLDGNYLSLEFPTEVIELTNLEVLSLDGTKGPIPPEVGRLVNLKTLRLGPGSSKATAGPIPPELGDLANLEHLHLGSSGLTGAIPPELGRLANLKTLGLEFNQLTGAIPPELGDLANLKTLSLASNQLTGSIPPELSGMRSLDFVLLLENQLSGCIPAELSIVWSTGIPLRRCQQ